MFKPWMLAAMEDEGYTDTSDGLINRVAKYLAKSPNDTIDTAEFRSACISCNVDPDSFTQTYNILKSTESFFTKINLHIIQCDADIQEDVKITSQEEFDKYINTMKIRGFGGTDFKPVFTYVEKLIKEKEFSNLKGLIYFTDGFGDFPVKKPNYETAFVFIDDDYNNYDVPPWAMKLILRNDEI